MSTVVRVDVPVNNRKYDIILYRYCNLAAHDFLEYQYQEQQDGDYVDALVRTRAQVVPMIMETTGGLAPHSRIPASMWVFSPVVPRVEVPWIVPVTVVRA